MEMTTWYLHGAQTKTSNRREKARGKQNVNPNMALELCSRSAFCRPFDPGSTASLQEASATTTSDDRTAYLTTYSIIFSSLGYQLLHISINNNNNNNRRPLCALLRILHELPDVVQDQLSLVALHQSHRLAWLDQVSSAPDMGKDSLSQMQPCSGRNMGWLMLCHEHSLWGNVSTQNRDDDFNRCVVNKGCFPLLNLPRLSAPTDP